MRRLTAQGRSVHEIARKAGIGRAAVLRWQGEDLRGTIARSRDAERVSEGIPSAITWQETLDAAWDVRRRIGGRDRYRAILREWALSFDEASDPFRALGPPTERFVTFYCDDGSRRRVAVA